MEKDDGVDDQEWGAVNPQNVAITAEFLEGSINLSPQTLKQYESGLKQFFWWVHNNAGDKPFYEIKPLDFLRYQNNLVKRGLSSSAVSLKRCVVSSLNNYVLLYHEEFEKFRNYVTKAIAAPPRQLVHEKLPLSLDEYEDLCNELGERGHWQQVAYLRFSFASGARRAEVRQLLKEVVGYEPKVIQGEGGEIRVYQTHNIRCKGRGVKGKIRKLQFDEEARLAIVKWLEIREPDDCPFVFVVKNNEECRQVGESTFNLWINEYVEPILGRRFHPHLIRSSRASTLVVEQGKDIETVRRLLGHESIETTERYVVRPDKDCTDDAFILRKI